MAKTGGLSVSSVDATIKGIATPAFGTTMPLVGVAPNLAVYASLSPRVRNSVNITDSHLPLDSDVAHMLENASISLQKKLAGATFKDSQGQAASATMTQNSVPNISNTGTNLGKSV